MVRMYRFRLLMCMAVFAWSCCAGGQKKSVPGVQLPRAVDPAVKRAGQLQRGMNTALWFAQIPAHTEVEHLRTFITEDDLKLIRQLGFDHIRLSVDPVPLVAWQHDDAAGTAFMAELDRVITASRADGLSVVLDLQPDDKYKQNLLYGDASEADFAALWGGLARHFAKEDADHVFFELMNEPEQYSSQRWSEVQKKAIDAIQEGAPGFTVIVSALNLDGLQDMTEWWPLYGVTNVIYTFHDYNPIWFTHQGAGWAGVALGPLHDVPYPSTPENVVPIVAQETADPGARSYIRAYGEERWNAARVEGEVSKAAAWGAKYHVPVYCGEFGVRREVAEPMSRQRFLHDMRVALERNHIGWAMWDYQADFGLVTKADGKTTVDDGVVKALGLTPAE